MNEELQKQVLTDEWSDALLKATTDPFDYAMKLRDGVIIRFERAERCENAAWARVFPSRTDTESPHSGQFPFPFPRGVEIRVSEIIWVGDAPEGS